MRRITYFWLTIVVVIAGACSVNWNQLSKKGTLKSPPVVRSENAEKKSAEILESVYKTLLEDPVWLAEATDVCPVDLMPQTEVAPQYLSEGCADDASVCFEKCRNDDANACYALALLIEDKKGYAQRPITSLYSRSCKLGIISGCTNRAALMINPDQKESGRNKCTAATFEKTCELNDPWGCTMFGGALANGDGVERDLDRALNVLSKSCILGDDDPACVAAKTLSKEIEQARKKTPKR